MPHLAAFQRGGVLMNPVLMGQLMVDARVLIDCPVKDGPQPGIPVLSPRMDGALMWIPDEILLNGTTMPDTSGGENDMRQPAEWMGSADDRILELVREHGNLTPKAMSALGGPTADYAARRAKMLVEAGLLFQVYPDGALYGLTHLGSGYLNEDVDGDDLPLPESVRDDEE